MIFSVQPLCPLYLCGGFKDLSTTEDTEVAQRNQNKY